ncbi:hypothetical protein PENPOL_c020G05048 [Penicillium polonicum]|uniref:Uncharacterized protein n=1 Tax=Penicillium polonicum TaxID=60169 RepID=A0A1V6N8D4_PENPO|nr:hypothetical protein PENPOL_c020G05048 [Penicillium polonicum]
MSGHTSYTFHLDDKKNVKVEDLANNTRLCNVLSRLKPLRDVDWATSRLRMTTLNYNIQAIAAHAQRCGDVMTPEESCEFCKLGHGAFRSCVVLSVLSGSSYLDGGCCMNCYFKIQREPKCSLWVAKRRDDVEGTTRRPSHSPLQYLQEKKRKRILEYDSTYYQSPLEQPNIKGKGKFGEKRQALESIHSVYDRVVQDMDRLFSTLSKANQLESGENTEEDEEDPVVVASNTDVEDTKETAVEAVVKVEEIDKKDVKIADSDLKREEEEQKPATSKKCRAARGKGEKAFDVEEK